MFTIRNIFIFRKSLLTTGDQVEDGLFTFSKSITFEFDDVQKRTFFGFFVQYIDAQIVRDLSLFKGKNYFIKTYGCQMNVHDTELIKNLVEGIGFSKELRN